jgi:ParB family transcriptional regulator, chromosome partitioning protein
MAGRESAATSTAKPKERRTRRPAAATALLAARARDPLFDLAETLPRLVELDVAAIKPNPAQPRQVVGEPALAELAESIERHGLLQPIVVKPEGQGYVLVAGQRRLLAHRRLGRERIPALLTSGRPDELALIENLQREDLAPLDEAEALAALKNRYGYSQDELARVLAKAKSTISELLSLNDLPAEVKAKVRANARPVAKSFLIELARLPDVGAQLTLWQALEHAPTVRAARAAKKVPIAVARTANELVASAALRLLEQLNRIEHETLQRDEPLRTVLHDVFSRLDRLLAT